jgi:hypothetical protein
MDIELVVEQSSSFITLCKTRIIVIQSQARVKQELLSYVALSSSTSQSTDMAYLHQMKRSPHVKAFFTVVPCILIWELVDATEPLILCKRGKGYSD